MARFGEDAPKDPPRAPDPRVFELLVQGVTDYAIYMIDPEGYISTWNAGARRLKGYDNAEIIGRHYSRFFTDEDQSHGLPLTALETARRLGRFEAEGWRVRKDGTRFWANAIIDTIWDESGDFVGFAKVTETSRSGARAQQALVESERRFRLLVEGIVDYAIYMLDPSGTSASWNAGAERFKGYAAARDHRPAFLALLHPGGPRGRPARPRAGACARAKASSSPRAGACARTARASGPAS